ncbi:hypothetical protein GGI35DRAFT_301160 [Trichoderma velutinum]
MYDFSCHICDVPEFDTESELDEHLEIEHYCCSFCNNEEFDTPEEFTDHQIEKHHLCWICEKDIECPVCPRKVSKESAMVLHLEVGCCPSGVDDEDIDNLAGECRQWPRFLNTESGLRYRCPTCGEKFKFMSGLLQHAESERCNEDLDETYGPLAIFLRFLRSRLRNRP